VEPHGKGDMPAGRYSKGAPERWLKPPQSMWATRQACGVISARPRFGRAGGADGRALRGWSAGRSGRAGE
jgi:hypothetical protein